MSKSNKTAGKPEYFLAYLIPILTGIVFFIVGNEKNVKRHALQAIFLGIVSIILSIIPFIGSILAFLVLLYGWYVGYEAMIGKEVKIPAISDFVNGLSY